MAGEKGKKRFGPPWKLGEGKKRKDWRLPKGYKIASWRRMSKRRLGYIFLRCFCRLMFEVAYCEEGTDPEQEMKKTLCYKILKANGLHEVLLKPYKDQDPRFELLMDNYIDLIDSIFEEHEDEMGHPGDIDMNGDDQYDGYGPCNQPGCTYYGRTIQGYCRPHYEAQHPEP